VEVVVVVDMGAVVAVVGNALVPAAGVHETTNSAALATSVVSE
jgi:hypothetical protein